MNDAAEVRVLVVDDQAPFRFAAKLVLKRTEGFELVGEASSGEESLNQVLALHPDLVLMDINMGEVDGLEATRRIVAAEPATVVFLCSTYELKDLPGDASATGARAYINKEELSADLLLRLWAARDDGGLLTTNQIGSKGAGRVRSAGTDTG